MGGRWDPDLRQWYVPEGKDPRAFATWLPRDTVLPASNEGDHSAGTGAPAQPSTGLATISPLLSPRSSSLPGPLAPAGLARGVSLSELLSGVSQLVSASFTDSVWVRVEVVACWRRRQIEPPADRRLSQSKRVASCAEVEFRCAQPGSPQSRRMAQFNVGGNIQSFRVRVHLAHERWPGDNKDCEGFAGFVDLNSNKN